MKDLFKNYHKHKVLTNLGILSLSAILAVSVNSFLLTGNTGEALKASVLEATELESAKVDFTAEHAANSLSFKNSSAMKEVSEISFSLAYDADIAELTLPTSMLQGATVTQLKNSPGFINYIISLDNPTTIQAATEILQVTTSKKEQSTSHLNIVNVNFKDSTGEIYLLTSEGIMF